MDESDVEGDVMAQCARVQQRSDQATSLLQSSTRAEALQPNIFITTDDVDFLGKAFSESIDRVVRGPVPKTEPRGAEALSVPIVYARVAWLGPENDQALEAQFRINDTYSFGELLHDASQ